MEKRNGAFFRVDEVHDQPAAWQGGHDDLVARGLLAPMLCIIDGNPGLRRAIGEVWPRAAVQRWCVHKLRNLEWRGPTSGPLRARSGALIALESLLALDTKLPGVTVSLILAEGVPLPLGNRCSWLIATYRPRALQEEVKAAQACHLTQCPFGNTLGPRDSRGIRRDAEAPHRRSRVRRSCQ